MSEMAPVLSMSNVSKVYRKSSTKLFGKPSETIALKSQSVTVLPNETLAIIGDSGSGKTTTTRILLGLIPPSSGDVFFRGKSLSEPSVRKALRASSGIIFQNPSSSFDPRWTLERSITEPLAVQQPHLAAQQKRDLVFAGLKEVGLDPVIYSSRYPVDLSGGQMQRAAFARAIINRPAVLLADEPMSAIDMPSRLTVLALLRALHEAANAHARQMATIIVSHDLGVVQNIADRVLVVHEGAVVEAGPPSQILNNPGCAYTRHLIAAASL